MFDCFFQRHGPWFSQINGLYGRVFLWFSFLLHFFPFSVFFLFLVFVLVLVSMFVIWSCLISLLLFFTLTSTLELFGFGFIKDNYVILFLHRVMFDFFFQRHGPWFSQIN